MSQKIILFAFSFVLSFLLTPLLRKVALYFNIVATPNPLVKTHKSATPYLGGVAIYLSFFMGLLTSEVFSPYITLLTCIGLMTAFGLIDDIKPFSPFTKLLGQILISILGIFFIFQINGTHLNPSVFFLYLLWLVVATNALNLIDVMDGLATGTSIISFAGLSALSFIRGADNLNLISLIFCGALLGFLPFNYHKARIFLGDAGSLMIGFSFGLFTLVEPKFNLQLSTFPLIILVFSVPLFELVFVFIMRTLSGKPFWKGSRDHFSLRLLTSGWKVPLIVGTTYAFGGMSIIGAIILEIPSQTAIRLLVLLFMICVALFVWKNLSKIEVQA